MSISDLTELTAAKVAQEIAEHDVAYKVKRKKLRALYRVLVEEEGNSDAEPPVEVPVDAEVV